MFKIKYFEAKLLVQLVLHFLQFNFLLTISFLGAIVAILAAEAMPVFLAACEISA